MMKLWLEDGYVSLKIQHYKQFPTPDGNVQNICIENETNEDEDLIQEKEILSKTIEEKDKTISKLEQSLSDFHSK